ILRTRSDYCDGLPPGLSAVRSSVHAKNYRYGQEPYFQESYRDFLSTFGASLSRCARFTYVLFKPDAFVCNSVERSIDILRERGFHAVTGTTVLFDRHKVRELWRYEFNIAHVERYRLVDELLCSGPSLLVVLEDVIGTSDASQRLSAQKGHSSIGKRPRDSLRAVIGARDNMLNFIHTPDEMIDMIREIGVLFAEPERLALLEAIRRRPAPALTSLISSLSVSYPTHSLLLDDLYDRLGTTFRQDVASHAHIFTERPYDLRLTYQARYDLALWDWITLVNSFLRFSHPRILPTFDFEVAE
ncbi:MAG: nucleoside-diphosphate kinase, partial [Nitratireductor sp.]